MSHLHNPVIPALTGAISKTDLVQYLTPMHSQNAGDGFGVMQYSHGITTVPNAYAGAVYSPTQNRIYMVPCGASSSAAWHYVNCDTGVIVAYTHGYGTTITANAYIGGCYSPTQNRIYFIPSSISLQATWHYLDCATGNVVSYAHGLGANPVYAYYGGVYSPTQNRIYLVPYGDSSAANWHYINCATGAVVAYAHGFGTTITANAYIGGCYSPTQDRIYLTPYGCSSVATWHYLDCSTGVVVAYAHGFGTTITANAYVGGCYSPTQNRIYFIPMNISAVAVWHYVDCNNGAVVTYAHGFGTTIPTQAYTGGYYSPTQNTILLIPRTISTAANWHYIDCATGTVIAYENRVTSAGSYIGGCYSPTQNRVYFAPYTQAQNANWHYIQEFSPVETAPLLMANGLFNKF